VAQYKKKTKAWKIEKNIPQRKIIPMVRKQDRRLVEGKQTTYIFRGQPVSNEKLERARKRFEKETAEHHPDSPVPGKSINARGSIFAQLLISSHSYTVRHRVLYTTLPCIRA
jgi:hypothetical protein